MDGPSRREEADQPLDSCWIDPEIGPSEAGFGLDRDLRRCVVALEEHVQIVRESPHQGSLLQMDMITWTL